MIKVLIVDDHTIVREGLRQILEETLDIAVTGEASSAQEAINKVKNNDFDIVLLDISLPGRNGLDVLKQLKSIKPDLPVLILSMYPEEQYAIRALRAKAAGYLTKESASDELIKAIRKISQGRKYITSSLAEKLAFELEDNNSYSSHEKLSDREYQVMCMIASGKRIKEIAEALSLSVKTISTYRTRILSKMNMKSTSQLIHYAIKSGLVD